MDLIESALEYKLNAVVFIDPVAMLFSTLKQGDILSQYRDFKIILHRFVMRPSCVRASCGSWIEKSGRADLLSDPRGRPSLSLRRFPLSMAPFSIQTTCRSQKKACLCTVAR